jgi:tripartite-type tricarboxylate transporter receptor subunit TctC
VVSLAWNGIFVPAGTPAAVVDQINADVNAALNEPSVRDALLKQGLVPGGHSPAEFKQLIEQESLKWAPIIREAEIKLD